MHHTKAEHELWFEKTRASVADKIKQAQDYVYSELVDATTKLCMFEEWKIWTSHALSTSPSWHEDWMKNVEEFRERIIRTIWSGALPELEDALKTLSINLRMALRLFSRHSERGEDGWVHEIRFYRFAQGQENYDRLLAEYNEWIDGQCDFLLEATKSANWVADMVRRCLNPMFFAVSGKFAVTTGPNMSLQFVTRVLEYSEEERKRAPEEALRKLSSMFEEQPKREKEMWGE